MIGPHLLVPGRTYWRCAANRRGYTVRSGAPMIKNEEGFLAGFVYVDTTVDLGTYVTAAQRAVAQEQALRLAYPLRGNGRGVRPGGRDHSKPALASLETEIQQILADLDLGGKVVLEKDLKC